MTDSRHYAALSDRIYRFLPMRLGPEDLERIHGTDERIAVDNYAECVRFYARLIQNAAGPP
jgi:carboxypeptidase PM20D1